MSTLQHLDDHIIARYTDQSARLPAELRRKIEHAWQGAPVQLYALADLDQSLRLTDAWLVLGPRHIAVAKHDSEGWEVQSVERSRIEAVREAPGLSANTLTILGLPRGPENRQRVRGQPRRLTDRLDARPLDALDLPPLAIVLRDCDVPWAQDQPGVRESQALVEIGERVQLDRRTLPGVLDFPPQLRRE